MTTKATPGPWHLFKETFEKITISGYDPSGALRLVATCQGSPDIIEANARLITAAPVMLTSLLRIEASLTFGSIDEPDIRAVALRDIRDALSLARSDD